MRIERADRIRVEPVAPASAFIPSSSGPGTYVDDTVAPVICEGYHRLTGYALDAYVAEYRSDLGKRHPGETDDVLRERLRSPWTPPASVDVNGAHMFVLFVETSDQMDKSEPVGIYSTHEKAEKAAAGFKRYRTFTRGFAVDDLPATISIMCGERDGRRS